MITINTRVSLGFLGDEYADSYLTFRSLPVRDLEKISGEIAAASKDDSKSFAYLSNMVQSNFVEGKIKQGSELAEVKADDLLDLPMNVITACIDKMIGKTDPKS